MQTYFQLSENNHLVLEIGSGIIKATMGVLELTPPTLIRTVYARRSDTVVFGNDVTDQDTPIYPIQRGDVVDVDGFCALLQHVVHTIYHVQRESNASPLLLAVPHTWSRPLREHVTQFVFEQLNAPGLLFADQAILPFGTHALWNGQAMIYLSTGTVLDVGYGTTTITPVFDMTILRIPSMTLEVGGSDLDAYFLNCLKQDKDIVRQFAACPELLNVEFARMVKESGACSVLTIDHVPRTTPVETVALQYRDMTIHVGAVRFQAAEPLFDPLLIHSQVLGLGEALYACIMACDVDKRASLWERLILTGGSCMFPDFSERLMEEIQAHFPMSDNSGEAQVHDLPTLAKIPEYLSMCYGESSSNEEGEETALPVVEVAPGIFQDAPRRERRDWSTYLGAVMQSKSTFYDPKSYMTKADYNERGPSIATTKVYPY